MELADRQSELPRLLWVLRNGKGFGLYFVCCNAPAYRRELVDKIKTEYAQPILEFDLTGHDGEEYIDHRLLTWAEDKAVGAPVFLYGLETLLPTRDEDRQFRTLQEINWRRNVYSQLNRNLVIWLPEYALTLLARIASDFYDWHSAVFEFPVPDAEKAGWVEKSLQGFVDGEAHAANWMTLAEKQRWLGVLNGLLDETPEDSAEHARLLNDLGRLHSALGQYEQALRNYDSSLRIVRKLGDQLREGHELINIAHIYRVLGETDKSLDYLNDALAINQTIGYRKGVGVTLNNISQIYYLQGDYAKALNCLQEALIINSEVGDMTGKVRTLNHLAQIFRDQGNYDMALDYLKHALDICSEIGNRMGEETTFTSLSQIYEAQGNVDKALDFLRQAEKIQREIGHWAGLCVSLNLMGNIQYNKGNQAEAEHAWLESFRIAKEIARKDVLQQLDKLAKDMGKEGLAYWESQS